MQLLLLLLVLNEIYYPPNIIRVIK